MKHPRILAPLFPLIILTSCFQLHAQEKFNQLKTSLVVPLGKVFEISYERMLNSEMSLQLGVGIGSMNYVNPQFRYYLSENQIAPSGAFISPFAFIGDEMTGGGLSIGYQHLYKQKISLEAYAGPLVGERVTFWGGINVGLAF